MKRIKSTAASSLAASEMVLHHRERQPQLKTDTCATAAPSISTASNAAIRFSGPANLAIGNESHRRWRRALIYARRIELKFLRSAPINSVRKSHSIKSRAACSNTLLNVTSDAKVDKLVNGISKARKWRGIHVVLRQAIRDDNTLTSNGLRLDRAKPRSEPVVGQARLRSVPLEISPTAPPATTDPGTAKSVAAMTPTPHGKGCYPIGFNL